VSQSTRPREKTTGAQQRKPRDLTRDKVIDAALALIDKSGTDALTMRSLAAAIGVTPMALYNHFSNKRDLLSAIAESVICAAEFDGGQADWRDRVHHCFALLRKLCLQHPGLPLILEFEGAAPASAFAPMEVTLRALHEAGLDDVDSVRTYFLLVGFTLSQAAYQTRPIPDLELLELARTERIAGRGYKAIERLALPERWDFDASFAFGISLILKGIEAELAQKTTEKPLQTTGDAVIDRSQKEDGP
jgi:TetR/AcrR family tetracycline transcriptional repressor